MEDHITHFIVALLLCAVESHPGVIEMFEMLDGRVNTGWKSW